MNGKHAADDQSATDDDRKGNLGDLNDDIGHTFDQTNGLVDGLGGDANEPEEVNDRLDEQGEGSTPVVAVAPGGTSGTVMPVNIGDPDNGDDRDEERDPDA